MVSPWSASRVAKRLPGPPPFPRASSAKPSNCSDRTSPPAITQAEGRHLRCGSTLRRAEGSLKSWHPAPLGATPRALAQTSILAAFRRPQFSLSNAGPASPCPPQEGGALFAPRMRLRGGPPIRPASDSIARHPTEVPKASQPPTSAPVRFSPAPRRSFRPERPDFLLRAEFWRVGPRSGGIPAPKCPSAGCLGLGFLFSANLYVTSWPLSCFGVRRLAAAFTTASPSDKLQFISRRVART
jgi:hypothetical protein